MRMKKYEGTRCFVQVGVYEGRNKRSNSTFRVIEGVKLDELKDAIVNAVNAMPKTDA